MNLKVWLHSLLAAAIGGASSAGLSALLMPDVFNLTNSGLVHLGKMVMVGAIAPVFAFLKQSPLPTDVLSVETTITQIETKG